MNEPVETPTVKPWWRKELTLFIGGSLVTAFLLVLVGMALYVSSGAELLDLSRPGYVSVRDEVNNDDTFQGFPSSGDVTDETINQFLGLYDTQVQQVKDDDAFSPDTLSNQAIGIDDSDN